MRRARRVNDQTLGVADIRDDAEEFDIVHKFDAFRAAAFDTEDNHSARAVRKILLRELVRGIAGKPGITDPCDFRMIFQEFRDLQSIRAVTLVQ